MKKMIVYKGKKTTEKNLIKDLRKRGVDINNNLTDEYLVSESYFLGEWEYSE